AQALYPYPHCAVATVALRKRRRCTPSAWAVALAAGAVALGQHLVGEQHLVGGRKPWL
ncbi:hypothetical protein B296_00049325, partial [Ensete ventricosum]